MRRKLIALAVASTLGSAAALYLVSDDTRRIERGVQERERLVDRTAADIAVLKAERAYLARPERIDALARGLGMRPLGDGQYVRLDEPGRRPPAYRVEPGFGRTSPERLSHR
jgi:cell division protein FtsL